MFAWLFGIGAILSLYSMYQQKGRKMLLAMKLCADICWVWHYFFLGAIAGMIPNFVGIFRELVFINRKKYKFANIPLWPILFILSNITLSVLSFEFWFDVLPIAASAFVTISLWIDNPNLTKGISVPVALAFLIYNALVCSYIGVINETISIFSIFVFFNKVRREKMKKKLLFNEDFKTEKNLIIREGAPIENIRRTITSSVSKQVIERGEAFANEITQRFVSDFEKVGDKMAHVSTFKVVDDYVYMTYYANTKEPSEDPKNQTIRFVYAPIDNIEQKTFIDLQTTGDMVGDKTIDMVYDCIFMQKDVDTLYIMWTASAEGGNYYRFYRPFNTSTKTLGEVGVNKFKVGNIVNDLSISGIKSALAENGIPCKNMTVDIGIMQKESYRIENGVKYCYSGLYNTYFNCIIKSSDLITWEYVSQPDFINDSLYENATYVLGDKVYYFVRQIDANKCGFLTVYNLKTKKWEQPIEIEDCQSRSDFIMYKDNLYLFHAPIDREHIGVIKINTDDIAKSEVVLQAKMPTSCFYPFIQYYKDGELAMSYTVSRKHIRLAQFDLKKYL